MAVANVSHKQKSVADPSTTYESLRGLWQKSRAVIGGERFVKDYDSLIDTVNFSNLLLPFSPSMTPQQYDFYRSEAELPGIVSQYAKVVVGGLLRKQPQLVLPEGVPEDAYDWIMNNFSQDGLPLVSFLDSALWEEVQTSRAWVYVDHPKVSNAEDMTPTEMLEYKPYPVLWNAESIINYKLASDEKTGCKKLQMVIVRGYEESFEGNEFHPAFIDVVRVHDISDGFYRIRKYRKKNEEAQIVVVNGRVQQNYQQSTGGGMASHAGYDLVETNESIVMHGVRLTSIPAWPLNGSFEEVEPRFMALIDKEIALYNKISRRNHLLYGAATYTPVIASDMSDDKFDEIVGGGLGTWIHLQKGDTASVLETPTAALADMDRAVAACMEEMAKLGIRMLSPETSASGVALEIRNAGQTSQLGTLNTKVGNQCAAIIAFMLNWRYGLEIKASEIGFELSADFNPVPLGADWLRLVTEWYEKGLIPRSLWLALAKQNDLVSADYNDDDGKQEINADDLVFTGKENVDFLKQQQVEQAALTAAQGV